MLPKKNSSHASRSRNFCSGLLYETRLLSLTFLALTSIHNIAYAQIQRSFVNLGFEDNLIADCNQYVYAFLNEVPGWKTTHSNVLRNCNGIINNTLDPEPVIEIWRSGFTGGSSPVQFNSLSGNQHAELNANEASKIYQTVCILEGDSVQWSFHHRGLVGTDVMNFLVGDENIVQASTSFDGTGGEDCRYPGGQCTSALSVDPVSGIQRTDGWRNYTGSFTWTGASSQQDFGFEAVSSGNGVGRPTNGNHIDDIQVFGIVPIVELDRSSAEGLEGEHTAANFPANILISGNIPARATLDVTLRIVHNETDAADIQPGDIVTIQIPEGNYAGAAFPIPLGILEDAIPENRESFTLEVIDRPGTGGYRAGSTNTCGDAGTVAMTYTILDAHASIEKTGTFVDLVGGLGPDGTPIKNAGDRMDYVFTVINTGDVDLDNLVVDDTIIGTPTLDPAQSDIGPDGRLMAGGKAVYLASYILKQSDIDQGDATNVATLTARLADHPDNPLLTASSDHEELLPHVPAISMVKVGTFDAETDDGDGLPDPGERLKFEITITNDGNISAHNAYPLDAGPTFEGSKGTGTMSAFQPGPMTLLPGEEQVFTAYYTLTTEDIAIGSGTEDGVANQASASADGPNGEPLEATMPAPMLLTMPGFGVEKRAEITQVQSGDKVPYTLTLKPLELIQTTRIRLADIMPAGFVYIPNSTTVDGIPMEPLIEGRRLTWELDVEPEQQVEVSIVLGVSAAVKNGTFTNIAQAERLDNDVVYRRIGKADVEVMPNPIFDCGDVLGKVFNDNNRNGYQDKGEKGVAGARVAGANGMLITTDQHGRFSIACADLPDGRSGSNLILKLDPRSLPTGHRILSENPRIVRLTAGKTSKVNFSTSISRVVRLDITDAAFLQNSAALQPIWQQNLQSLLQTLQTEPSILRIKYVAASDGRQLANQRLKGLRAMISSQWRETINHYRLEIETQLTHDNAFVQSKP